MKVPDLEQPTKTVKRIKTKEELLSTCNSYSTHLLLLSFLMSLNWGLSGMYLIVPAYISPSIPNPQLVNFTDVVDEYFPSSGHRPELEWVASSFSAGNLIVGPLLAKGSDRYGRRIITIISILGIGLFGVACAFANSFSLLVLFRFIQGSFYYPSTMVNWILVTESTPKAIHAKAGVLFGFSWIVGSSLVAPAVAVAANWRTVMLILAAPNVALGIILAFYLHESLEFSLLKRKEEAIKKYVLRVNSHMKEVDIYKYDQDYKEKPKSVQSFLSFLKEIARFRRTTKIMSIACYMCFTSTLLHNALSLTSTVIDVGNVHVNFVLSSFVELPSYVCVPLLFNKLGEISTLVFFHGLTALSSFFSVILEQDEGYLATWMGAKFACSSAFMCFLIYSADLYPTEHRNFCIALTSTIGNIAAVVAPQMVLLNQIHADLMFVVFGLVSVLAAALVFMLPKDKSTITY